MIVYEKPNTIGIFDPKVPDCMDLFKIILTLLICVLNTLYAMAELRRRSTADSSTQTDSVPPPALTAVPPPSPIIVTTQHTRNIYYNPLGTRYHVNRKCWGLRHASGITKRNRRMLCAA